jgi:hypothetical protein
LKKTKQSRTTTEFGFYYTSIFFARAWACSIYFCKNNDIIFKRTYTLFWKKTMTKCFEKYHQARPSGQGRTVTRRPSDRTKATWNTFVDSGPSAVIVLLFSQLTWVAAVAATIVDTDAIAAKVGKIKKKFQKLNKEIRMRTTNKLVNQLNSNTHLVFFFVFWFFYEETS